jgi:hypothetical protein
VLADLVRRPTGALTADALTRWLLAEGLASMHAGLLAPTLRGAQIGAGLT